MERLLIRDVRIDGRPADVLLRDGVIAEIGRSLNPAEGHSVLDGAGGALLPGLHDHHIHLLATAAARLSVSVGPTEAPNRAVFEARLRAVDASLAPGRWLRAVGYHESVGGPLDRHQLDAISPGRPIRVQHRSGALWVLNSVAITALGSAADAPPGAERDANGQLTGRFHRADAWLRKQLPHDGPPDLEPLGRELARLGITGVTDATPFRSLGELAALHAAVTTGDLPQRVVVMGGIDLAGASLPGPLVTGPVKIILDDHDLPSLAALTHQLAEAHGSGRPVAIHCVTRASLTLALVAWQTSGTHLGDRIEHGSVIPPELRTMVADLGLTVVTQPAFIAERGDQYLTDVDTGDLPHLYPCGSLLDAGVAVAASSDAPYTSTDPWAGMRAAATRTTATGRTLGPDEAISPARALQLYLGHPALPGSPAQRVAIGVPADLCLLDGPSPTRVDDLTADRVAATLIAGRVVD